MRYRCWSSKCPNWIVPPSIFFLCNCHKSGFTFGWSLTASLGFCCSDSFSDCCGAFGASFVDFTCSVSATDSLWREDLTLGIWTWGFSGSFFTSATFSCFCCKCWLELTGFSLAVSTLDGGIDVVVVFFVVSSSEIRIYMVSGVNCGYLQTRLCGLIDKSTSEKSRSWE